MFLDERPMPIESNRGAELSRIKNSEVQNDTWIRKPEKNQKIPFCNIFLLWGNPKIKTPNINQDKNPTKIRDNWKPTPKLRYISDKNKARLNNNAIPEENLSL